MNHTLETIKKALDHHVETQDAVSFGYLKHEIEGFKKELREIIEQWRRAYPLIKRGQNPVDYEVNHVLNDLEEEVFGETKE